MNIPGFTAETSLRHTYAHYQSNGAQHGWMASRMSISPQFSGCRSVCGGKVCCCTNGRCECWGECIM